MIVKSSDAKIIKMGEGCERKVLASKGKLMTTELNIKKGVCAPKHSHPHEQSNYILKGSMKFEIGLETVVLEEGDSCYIEPNVPHKATALEDSRMMEIFTPLREDIK